MSNVEMGKFRYGASEFMSYWLPMILFMGNAEETRHIAYMMVFKYRNAYLTKEEAESVSKRELNEILTSVFQIADYTLKAAQIVESLKSRHYYPEPQYVPSWEKEWNVNEEKYN